MALLIFSLLGSWAEAFFKLSFMYVKGLCKMAMISEIVFSESKAPT